MFFFRASTSERSEPVTVLMIVRKRSEFEKVPDAVVFQLQLRAAGDVASEERQQEMGSRLKPLKQLQHAGKQFAFATRQFRREKMDVAVQERAHVFGRRRNFVFF